MTSFAFDIDGTICSDGRTVDPLIKKQLLRLLDIDVNLAFASARPVRDMLPVLGDELANCLMVGCNGGVHYHKGEILGAYYFDKEQIAKVVKFLRDNSIAYVLDGAWDYSLSDVFHPYHRYVKELTDFEISEEDMFDKGVTKLLVLDDKYKYLVEDFFVHHKIIHSLNVHSRDKCFDITPNINSKAMGLVSCGVDMNKTTAFGNDINDYEMLKEAELSIFVGDNKNFKDADFYVEFSQVHKVLKRLIDNR